MSRPSTRDRLIQSALSLFASQGIAETTTKQIAEQAEVNEVTLFRHFGNKYGLLLAVIGEGAAFDQVETALVQPLLTTGSFGQGLQDYALGFLAASDRVPELLRSLVGEARHYSPENRQVLAHGFAQVEQAVAKALQVMVAPDQWGDTHDPDQIAALLNRLLLGHALMALTSEEAGPWRDRDALVAQLGRLFQQGFLAAGNATASVASEMTDQTRPPVTDLSSARVHEILQTAKKQDAQSYALMYVLFGAGVGPSELLQLERVHYLSDRTQQSLCIGVRNGRQVPINQWILGKRYGSYHKNPLTQWLRSRKDDLPALFLNSDGTPLTAAGLNQYWQGVTADISTVTGRPPALEQAQQTWCVEMFMRGMALEDMEILTGWSRPQLAPFVQRAREKTAIEQAIRMDQKKSTGSSVPMP
ncbi:MAG: TetR/AcrR family transcriptional regulator [Cyanobacteria bacterium]|nr:TetR/AcrR family transcriptional regulator [Cyanobacteriota bacterium]MDA0865632.1 TetR/AcrR family transcriptional regulator [Cyanobacteriota bacterium]